MMASWSSVRRLGRVLRHRGPASGSCESAGDCHGLGGDGLHREDPQGHQVTLKDESDGACSTSSTKKTNNVDGIAPGVDFVTDSEAQDRRSYSCRVIPERGSWVEINVTKKDAIAVRIDSPGPVLFRRGTTWLNRRRPRAEVNDNIAGLDHFMDRLAKSGHPDVVAQILTMFIDNE